MQISSITVETEGENYTAVGLFPPLSHMTSLEPNTVNDRRGPVADGYITVASPTQIYYSSLGHIWPETQIATHTFESFLVIVFLGTFSLWVSQKIPALTEVSVFSVRSWSLPCWNAYLCVSQSVRHFTENWSLSSGFPCTYKPSEWKWGDEMKSTHHVLGELWLPVFQELFKHLYLVLDPD